MVLVILAILAAMLTPALLGYVDKAKEKKDVQMAKAYMDAAQAGFVEAYGKSSPVQNGNVLGVSGVNDYGDVNAINTSVGKMVRDCMGEEPYIFVVATGNSNKPELVTRQEMFTVYYAIYVRKRDDPPYYYYNGRWEKKNATNIKAIVKDTTNKTNKLGDQEIQYYILSNKGNLSLSGLGENTFWGYLRKTLDQKYNGKTADNTNI